MLLEGLACPLPSSMEPLGGEGTGEAVLSFWPFRHDSQNFSFLEKGKQTSTFSGSQGLLRNWPEKGGGTQAPRVLTACQAQSSA